MSKLDFAIDSDKNNRRYNLIRKEDTKMFISLVLWMLIPSIYFAIRMYTVTINSVDIDILGQMEWYDLIDEICENFLKGNHDA